MPYTPPSQQSPASTRSSSPTLNRSPTQLHDNGPRSPSVGRPSPPRSMASSSYLRKHRRSPSVSHSDVAPPTPTEAPDPLAQATPHTNGDTIPKAPHNLVMSTGAVLSPPDSSENSDGDSEQRTNGSRGRELEKSWEELQDAVRAIDQRRESSPEKESALLAVQHTSAPISQSTSPTALSAEARKISHSRSSTETAIIIPRAQHYEAVATSSDSDDDDDSPSKPPLVRKKSGELVKPALRPSSRRRYSSMPGTPTYHKSVHFNDSDNQTRHFLQVDKPIAVSAGTSPVEMYESEVEFPFDGKGKSEREMKLCNFPEDTFERKTRPVRVDRIFLSADKQTLVGVVAVQNLAFQKLVVARFTLDYWQTTSEVVAEFSADTQRPCDDGLDRFNFQIKLSDQANIDNKSLLLCVRYNVGGKELWDNNAGANYQIDFIKTAEKPSRPSVKTNIGGTRPLNAIPRSRHLPPSPSRGRQESLDDDFASNFENGPSYHFGSPDKVLDESGGSIKLKPRSKRTGMFTAPVGAQSTNGLGGRYDFGASLSAALSTAQDKLGRESGLMSTGQKPRGGSYFGTMARSEGPKKAQERPDELNTAADRPAIGSDQYKDLVQKFCYFTPSSSAGKIGASSPPPKQDDAAAAHSGNNNNMAKDTASSTSSSGSSTPSPSFDGSNERAQPSSAIRSPFVSSRSGSPAPATGGGMGGRATSPISFGYPYHSSANYLVETSAPTAIRG